MELKPPKVIPILAYRDLQAIHDFLVDAFGMQPGVVERDGEGRPVHAEIYDAGGNTVWLHRHAPDTGLSSPADVPSSTGGVVVLVEDVDAHFQHAKSRGAQIDYEPMNQDYGFREYGARDPEGGRWYFSQPLEEG